MPSAKDKVERPEEMYVDISRTAELRVFEVVMLEIRQGMRHVGFARQERLFPKDLFVANDTTDAADLRRQRTQQKLGSDRGRAQLGVGEPEIVAALGYVI